MQLNEVQKYLLECVNSDGYGIKCQTDQEKINFLAATIKSEMGWNIEQNGLLIACRDWLQGLASACSIEYWDQGATELLLKWGYSKRYAENVDNYWRLVARNLAQLIQKAEVV